MPPTHWKAFREKQEEPGPENPGAGGARKESRGPREGWVEAGRNGKEEAERAGALSLSPRASAGPSGVTVGRTGRKPVLAGRAGSVPRGHHTPPAAARTCRGWTQAALATNVKCQSFGIWGSALKALLTKSPPSPKPCCPCPTLKTLPAMPYPTAVFKLMPVPLLPAPPSNWG